MRGIVLALIGAALLGTVGPASAADMAVREAPVPIAAAYNWNGVYVGGHIGRGWSNTKLTDTVSDGAVSWPDLDVGQTIGYSQSGVVGGGHIGINFQVGTWVYGLELSGSGAGISGGATTLPGSPFSSGDDIFSSKISALFLLTGRVGFTWERALVYAKGGFAGARARTSVSDTFGSIGAGSGSNWRSGFTAGVGVEYAMSHNLVIGIEYDYARLGAGSVSLGDANGQYAFHDDARDLHLLLGRVSYKFGGL
jgi:outer membrane immunogenic protein